ncbi:Proteolipid protein 2 [Batrachochytrium dendrobatidis]|nr:Proteolipid protein 2 [Batrachochytrium dendrobatidis]
MSEDTEWNDVLRDKGILPPKPKELEITEDEIAQMIDKTVHEMQHGKALEDRTLDELDELEDLEDDRVLESYRRQRMADMKAQLAAERFGSVIQISKPDYNIQVTEASKTAWVVVHMFQSYASSCKLLNAILDRLAEKHKSTKFCKIVADLCIPNYPDKNLPTLLIYGEGDMRKQLIGMDAFGGTGATVESVETVLATLGAISADSMAKNNERKDDDDDDQNTRRSIRTGFSHISKSSASRKDEDDDDGWD